MIHLGIRGRLVLGFALLLAILAAAVGTALVVTESHLATHGRLVGQRVPAARASADLAAQVYASLGALRGWLITGDEAFRAESRATWREIAELKEELRRLSGHWEDPEELRLGREVQPLIDRINIVDGRLIVDRLNGVRP